MSGYRCNDQECLHERLDIETISLDSLERKVIRCEKCPKVHKSKNKIAKETYQSISIQYAESFNNNMKF